MADKAISQLTPATSITSTDLFVLQQSNEAKSLSGQILINWLTAAADGHGGISTIAKTGTSDLVDTYTITYADETTSTFTVTNGEKGDQGDPGTNYYVHIKYAAVEPTQDSDMKSTADDWMGIYSGTSSSPPTTYTSYTWFEIKGDTGDTGTSITGVTLQSTSGLVKTYLISFSDGTSTTFTVTNGSSIATIAKTGTSGLVDTYTVTLTDDSTSTFTVTNGRGITSITNVDVTHAAGHTDEYRMNFSDGDTFTFYIYNGTNGSGSVSTVDSIPASNQDVPLLTLGTGAPTTSTVGALKSRYFDTANSQLYICIGIDTTGAETTYTWAGSSVTVDSALSSNSTNPVQNAVLTGVIGTASLDTTAQTLTGAVNELHAGKISADELSITVATTDWSAAGQDWPHDSGGSSTPPSGETSLTCYRAEITSGTGVSSCVNGDDFKFSSYTQAVCPADIWVYIDTGKVWVASTKAATGALTIKGLVLHM